MQSSVPRDKIPWFPKIDFDACIGDQECVNFCKNDVFVWDELKNRPEVIRPLNCVVGCDACSQICPAEAISFPSERRTQADHAGVGSRSSSSGWAGRLTSGTRSLNARKAADFWTARVWMQMEKRQCYTEFSRPWLTRRGSES